MWEVITTMGWSLNAPITVLASRLCDPRVAWRKQIGYECFASTESSFEVEATKFLQVGYYDSELGNTMPLAMANALKVSIVLTSLSYLYSLLLLMSPQLMFYTWPLLTVDQANMMVQFLQGKIQSQLNADVE